MINLSLNSGSCPKKLEDTEVVRLLKKKGGIALASNIQPISRVDYLSKVFERVAIDETESILNL